MRNRRGEITTILTIGALVVIGIATIASSFNINKKQTTSSRASGCTTGTQLSGDSATKTCSNICSATSYISGTQWTSGSTRFCCCTGGTANTPIPTLGGPAPTQSGGNGPPAGRTCERTASFTECKEDHAGSWEYLTVGTGKWCCQKAGGTNPSATPPPANDNWTCNGKGGEDFKVSSDTQCSNYCKGNDSEYVPGSQGYIGTQHYCCCTAPLPPDGDDSCCLLKCPADGAPTSVVWAPSLRAGTIPLTSCDGDRAYNTGWLYLCKDTYHCEGGAIKPGGVVPPPPTATCQVPGFGTIPRDGKTHCLPQVTAKAYAMCTGTNENATISYCHNEDKCRAGGGLNGGDGCKPPADGTTECIGDVDEFDCTDYCAPKTGNKNIKYALTGIAPNVEYWTDTTCKTAFAPKTKCVCGAAVDPSDEAPTPPSEHSTYTTCKEVCGTETSTSPDKEYQIVPGGYKFDPQGPTLSANKVKVECGCAMQGWMLVYSKCDMKYDCRESSQKNNPKCVNYNDTDIMTDCRDMCLKGTWCYGNLLKFKPYLYCCEEKGF